MRDLQGLGELEAPADHLLLGRTCRRRSYVGGGRCRRIALGAFDEAQIFEHGDILRLKPCAIASRHPIESRSHAVRHLPIAITINVENDRTTGKAAIRNAGAETDGVHVGGAG